MSQEILETGKPLSQCVLWRIQEESFRTSGIDAWEQIPSYPTTNPFIADAYAELIVAFLLDSRDRLVAGEPVYIVELGAGTGRFGFHVLKELDRKRRHYAALDDITPVYVLTDIASKNVRFWEDHEAFRPYRERGLVDFALHHPDVEREVKLRAAGTTLAPGRLANPLIAVANYVFDAQRQDLFRVADGGLEEVRLTISRDGSKHDPARPPSVDQLVVAESYAPAPVPYYGDPRLDSILDHYVLNLDLASVIFPIGAFDSIRNLEALAGGDLVLLASDKGFTHMGYMSGHWEHRFSLHGDLCLSYMVNFHAIRRHAEEAGGSALFTSDDSLFLQTVMTLPPPPPGGRYERCRHQFEERVARRNAINDLYDVQQLVPGAEPVEDPKVRLRRCLALVRLCNFDPIAYRTCGNEIAAALEKLLEREEGAAELADALLEATDRVRENYYLVNGDDRDVLYAMGTVYCSLGKYDLCIETFRRCVDLFGEDAFSLYYIASAHEMLEAYDVALDHYERGHALDPTCEATAAGLKRMNVQLRRV